MAQRFINPAPRYFDNKGHILSYGRLYFYQPGTLLPKDTFADPGLTVLNENPVELSGDGLQPDIFGSGGYRVICTDRFDRNIFDRDNVSVLLFPFSDWSESTAYGLGGGNIVTGSDGNYYLSLADDNVGNDPVSSPGEWQLISFFPGSTEQAENVIEMGELIPQDQGIIVGDGTGWTVKPIATYLYAYLQGFGTANNTIDADHDIDVSVGVCADSTNVRMMTLEAPLTKQIDATWSAGTGAGGMASGSTLSPSSTYHVFAVSVSGVIDIMFDSSAVCANGVANNDVDYFRRIASVMTDASSNIVPYIQNEDLFTLKTSVNNQDGDISAGVVSQPVTVPSGISVLANLGVTASKGVVGGYQYVLIDSLLTEAQSASDGNATIMLTIAEIEVSSSAQCQALTNTSAQVRRTLDQSGTAVDIYLAISTIGWEDVRGK